ncbi:MAG: NPXTG-anchored protein [Ruminococcus sp.]|nr:NPXTG-anchored protein [Ruminococcus sp.]
MKKNIFKSAIAALAVSALAVSASAVSAFAGPAAGQAYDPGSLDVNSSTVKPTLTLDQKSIDISAIGTPVTINLTVAGAEGKYAPTGLHIQYDSRLTLVKRDGEFAEKGAAGKQLGYTEEYDTANSFFVTTMADDNKGRDGVLWIMDFQVPSDAKVGDKYPIEIAYQSRKNNEDLFTNVKKDNEGLLMQAWTFMNGIEQGYIAIAGTTTTTTTSGTTSTTAAAGSTTTSTSGSAKTTAKATTTKKATTTTKKGDSPKTGVAGAGVAAAGLAVAVATAFALRKKED